MSRLQQDSAGKSKEMKSDLPSRREAKEVFGKYFQSKGIETVKFNSRKKSK
jgi:hypothetical protein